MKTMENDRWKTKRLARTCWTLWMSFFLLGPFILLSFFLWPDSAGARELNDRTLSPYFFVRSDDPEIDRLPLKGTRVQVNIAGVIADVTVIQVYKNEGKRPIEAVYVFPASTKAAVSGLKMIIGDRTIVAEIRRRDEARRIYEQAKSEGKSASLLEQHRPNVFQMNVANILPGDVIKTELHYNELLIPEAKTYEFVYPTVVGPRYSNQTASEGDPSDVWVENPYLHEGEPPTTTFDISVNIDAGLPIKETICTSHAVDIKYQDPSRARIRLAATEKFAGNKDFILRYRLAGDKIESGLLLYKGEEENFFLLMMQPPARVVPQDIPPREYIFIMDVSGSMHGFPLTISKRLFKNLASRLRPTDKFNVLLFAGGSQLFARESLPASPENVKRAIEFMDRQKGGGGTELMAALERAVRIPRKEGFSRTVVIATDGYVTVEAEAFDFIRAHLKEANFFPFGIGKSVNRFLIEGLARAGGGEPLIITKPEEAAAKADNFCKLIQAPVLTDIKVSFEGFDAFEVEPSNPPDLFAERPIIMFGKWRGVLNGEITVTGVSGDGLYRTSVRLAGIKPSSRNSALRYLWARHRIAQLGDYNRLRRDDDRISAIVDLGLKYNLLTAYTSFVAVDSLVRAEDGKLTTVKQPLPLPEGVTDYAVGQPLPAAGVAGFSRKSAVPWMSAQRTVQEQSQSGLEDKSYKTASNRSEEAAKQNRFSMRIMNLRIDGKLSEKVVREELQKHLDDFRNCFGKATAGAPEIRLLVKFTLSPKGEITSVQLEGLSASYRISERCLEQRIKRWHFPSVSDRVLVIATIRLQINVFHGD